MKVSVLTVLGVLLSAQLLFAQNSNVDLLVQSPNGKTVKLLWFIKKWSSDMMGFDIKRRDGMQGWVKLNREPIIPGISAKKKLSIVESDKMEESRIKTKLYRLVKTHKLLETDNKTYLRKLNNNNRATQDIEDMIARDYDIALINGFAYVDHSVRKKLDYQYGLFIQGTDKLLDSVTWDYGQVPDLNTVREITSRSAKDKNGIEMIWNADLNKMKVGDVAGFNIYRDGMRLNLVPIVTTNSKDSSEFTWYDKSADATALTQYSISAESLFGIEGMISSYRYNPADHPAEYKKAEVTEVVPLGFYFKRGISVKWIFPKDYERYIKGFYVEKDNMPDGYTRVSSLLEPSARSIKDTSASQVSGYIRYRVIAIYNDRTKVKGVERIYNYFPIRKPPIPQNLKAKSAKSDKKVIVSLSWDLPINGDSITDYFVVYVSDPSNDKLVAVTGDKPLRKNNYTFIIDHGSAYTYAFGVSSISKNYVESSLSDTVAVSVPSLDVPTPDINKVFADSTTVIVQWQYPVVTDLKGFRLFQNKNVIAAENELNKNARQFVIPKLERGAAYEYTIQAVTENNVLSERSSPQRIIVPDPFK